MPSAAARPAISIACEPSGEDADFSAVTTGDVAVSAAVSATVSVVPELVGAPVSAQREASVQPGCVVGLGAAAAGATSAGAVDFSGAGQTLAGAGSEAAGSAISSARASASERCGAVDDGSTAAATRGRALLGEIPAMPLGAALDPVAPVAAGRRGGFRCGETFLGLRGL